MAETLRVARRRAGFEPLEKRELLSASPTADNVLVLYNPASVSGTQVANYYAQVHPGVHLLPINGVDPNSEDMTADDYLSIVRPQVLAGLTSSIEVIVTTKGLPLRLQVTETPPTAPFPAMPTYTDSSGVVHSIQNWQAFSSFESELTNVNIVNSWLMMGDQSYALPGGQWSNNPYYRSTAAFDRAVLGNIFLTARLDGYTVGDVLASIDRAQHAYIEPDSSPTGPYYFLIDNDPSKTYAQTMANLASGVLVPAGIPMVYDNTSAFVSTAPGPVIGYDSHGVHQASTPANYITSGLNVTLANGAVFNSWESYNAYSFNVGGYAGNQGQVAQWLARGGTAGVGNVQEPGVNSLKVANEDLLFGSLLAGRTWGEAAWSSLAQLGYVNTVIGDPLMTWQRLPSPGPTSIAGRHLFYNESAWDGSSADANALDDAAVAVDKVAYQGGAGLATFANVSSYTKGINGIMVDISGPHGEIAANDFVFKAGNSNSPELWSAAPAPALVTVRAGAGDGGSDRVEITWPSGAIAGEWIEVQLRGNDALGGWDANTRLTATDTFFFGSAVADTGAGDTTGFSVNSTDAFSVRSALRGRDNLGTIVDVNDFNRDRAVTSADQFMVRSSATNSTNQLIFLDVSAAGPFAPAAVAAAIANGTTAADNALAFALSQSAGLTMAATAGAAAGAAAPSAAIAETGEAEIELSSLLPAAQVEQTDPQALHARDEALRQWTADANTDSAVL
jgi:uncharacterized protein (TIGR03790 family)